MSEPESQPTETAQQEEPELEKSVETQTPVTDSQPEQDEGKVVAEQAEQPEASKADDDKPQEEVVDAPGAPAPEPIEKTAEPADQPTDTQILTDEPKEEVVAAKDEIKAESLADKGEVPPTAIDDTHDVQSDVASNPVDDKLLAVGESRSPDISAGNTDIPSQIEEDKNTSSGTEAVPVTTGITTVEDTSNDNDLMTSNDTIETIPVQTNVETHIAEASGPGEDHPETPEVAGHELESENSSDESKVDQAAEVVAESVTPRETVEREAAPQEVASEQAVPQTAIQQEAVEPSQTDNTEGVEQQGQEVHEPTSVTAQPDAVSEDSTDKLAAGAGALAAGSLLVASAAVDAADDIGENENQSSQDDDAVRDISEGIPSEPSAHDLPPDSPSPDAATTVESSKNQSAGSQYGTFTSDQQEPQAVQSELRERSAASGAKSSAKSSQQDVVVKDEVVAKPSAASTTPGKLTILASMALGAYAVFKLANGAWGSRYP